MSDTDEKVPYEALYTAQFFKASKKTDTAALKVIVEAIRLDPYHAHGSHPLRHEWAGFRAATFRASERIIYRVCEECVQKNQTELNPLSCCAKPEIEKRVVMFVDFGDYHNNAGRRRITYSPPYQLDIDQLIPGKQDLEETKADAANEEEQG